MVRFRRKWIHVFFIETKFISKLFKKFRRQNESQEIPRLRLFMFSWKIGKISSTIIQKMTNQDFLEHLCFYDEIEILLYQNGAEKTIKMLELIFD